MNKLSKKLILISLLFVIFFSIFKITTYFVESNRNKKESERLNALKKDKINTEVNSLISKYDAIVDWYNFLINKPLRFFLTIDVENNILKGNKPLLIYTSLEDLIYKNNKYIGLFKTSLIGRDSSSQIWFNKLLFELDCTEDQINYIKSKYKPHGFGKFAIIAKLSSVEIIRKSSNDNDSDFIKAYGKCLDITYVSLYYDKMTWF